MPSTNYLTADAHKMGADVVMHDVFTALRMDDDELRRYHKEDLARALAQMIVDKIPAQEYTKDSCSHMNLSIYVFPAAAFWEVVRAEARRMANKALGMYGP